MEFTMEGIVFDVQHNSFVDGPGIRTTVFFKGCNLRCAWCHNPESQSFAPQLMFYRDKCKGCGKCLEKCPHALRSCTLCGQCERYCPENARRVCGRTYSAARLFEEIEQDKIFYDTSGGGATFSGGECLLQPDFLEELLKACKAACIHTAVDTAGCVPYASFERILPFTDMFLYDVKLMDPEKHALYTGADNRQILENLAKLLQQKARVWVRVPVIAGINDTEENMRALGDFYLKHGCPEKTELLPYHRMGENKYAAIGRETSSFQTPSKEKMDFLCQALSKSGCVCCVP